MSRMRLSGSEADLRAILLPRDNVLVQECRHPRPSNDEALLSGSATFSAVAGPFDFYERNVTWAPDGTDNSIAIEQSVIFRLAIPYWRWLFHPPAARALRTRLDERARLWWATPDRLSPEQTRVVAAATLLNVVGGMLYGLLTQVLTFVSASIGDGSSSEQTNVLAFVRAGFVVTLIVSALADRVGRRRTAILAFYASAGITLVTAFAPSMSFVAGAQFLARNLAIAALLCADTIALEEMPAGSRAVVAGLGTLAYGLGAGIVVATLPLTDLGDWGWRLTFIVAGASLPLIIHCRRYLPESHRFRELATARSESSVVGGNNHKSAGHGDSTDISMSAPLNATDSDTTAAQSSIVDRRPICGAPPADGRLLSRHFALRLLLVGSIFILLNVFLAPASQLQNDYLRTQAGFGGSIMALFVLTTSTPGGIGVLVGGRVADRYGRRWAIMPGLVAIGAFYTLFFATTGPLMWVASLAASIIGGMAAPALAVVTAELFPTARRATVRGIVTSLAVVGSIIGLLSGGVLIDRIGYGTAFTVLAIAPLGAAALAMVLPATHRRELEETSA